MALPSSDLPTPSFQTLNQYLQRRVLGQERAVMAAAFKLWAHACKREPLRPLSLILYAAALAVLLPGGAASLVQNGHKYLEDFRVGFVQLVKHEYGMGAAAHRLSGLVGFQPLDEPARVAITAKQITALAREYGLNVVQTAPHLARALTPRQAVMNTVWGQRRTASSTGGSS